KENRLHHSRQPLTAIFRGSRQRWPASCHVLIIGFLETGGWCYLVRVRIELATLAVTWMVQREQDFGCKTSALFQYLIDGLCIQLGIFRQLLQLIRHIQQLVQHELHVAQRRNVLTHETSPPAVVFYLNTTA